MAETLQTQAKPLSRRMAQKHSKLRHKFSMVRHENLWASLSLCNNGFPWPPQKSWRLIGVDGKWLLKKRFASVER
ncbi:TPA: hypothetical protein ACHTCR_001958 [Pseudomonas putida]|jgi:hypothetical protein|uniref:hypothetical protein n=1 Tax=Pseudomonas TaxID=286 RepID=UPI00114C9774|nr:MULTISPECIES: hypothetical protein [Pseudomonas]MCE1000312.1 hypothetical protein [Pseudomonas sp. NMI1173_11]